MRPAPLMPFSTRDGVADAPIEPAARGRGAPERPGGAQVVRAVGLRAGGEFVALDRPLEALALAGAGDLDGLADLEGVDGHGVADLQLARLVAELAQRAHGRRVDLLEMTEQRLVERFLAHGAEPELNSFIAVRIVGADRRHVAGAGLQHGDSLDLAVVEESLGHAELLGEDGGHINRRRVGSRCPRRRADGPGAGASPPSWAWADGCRSGACASGSRNAP